MTAPTLDAALTAFYVTIQRGQKTCYAAGPFAGLAHVEPWVDPVRAAAAAIDPWTWFDTFGVSRVTDLRNVFPAGRLNARVGLPPDPRVPAETREEHA